MERKGIILAGGTGSRLSPLTKVVSKQLLPVFDKPMIYYPISILMLSGIRDILIISTPRDLPNFEALLGNGKKWGLNFEYIVQEKPDGLAQAYILGEKFLNGSPSVLILGDNIFYGPSLKTKLLKVNAEKGATIFAYRVNDPHRYGVVSFNKEGIATGLEEKPKKPKSNYCVTGLYFFDNNACEYAKEIKPSARGELEITDLNKMYLKLGNLSVERLSRGYAWLDTGTHESLLEAQEFVKTVEHRQGLKICCPEEIAYRNGWINESELLKAAEPYIKSSYGEYLIQVTKDPLNEFL
ncbi:glucose-1-phosphate thymidylyltransferase RfbA [uncultured Prochlorococcus sp.]|uniref:glucose-1-phosphate thymidylyltransferase RfbA n=1 Tax=uncultured Prochlorococcus sp. TaxID=159733 RepID=UPI002582A3B7|nr:glucose-1-phosphate thymidylyltransferase RfbA [uncultured Prochlorococcus sp.]